MFGRPAEMFKKDRPGADQLRFIFMSSALCECKVFSTVPVQASSLQLTLAALTSRLRLVEIRQNEDIEKSRNSAGRLCRVDDNGASGARPAGTVRRPPGFMDRLRQYRTFGRITGTAEVPSDI